MNLIEIEIKKEIHAQQLKTQIFRDQDIYNKVKLLCDENYKIWIEEISKDRRDKMIFLAHGLKGFLMCLYALKLSKHSMWG